MNSSLKMFSSSAIVSGLLKTRCHACYRIQNYATRKRFYRGTGIVQNGPKWEVTLDHRRLKTPSGSILTLNSEPLARAIAAEWDAQTDVIAQSSMHLTALCNTSLDNPARLTKHDITSYLLEYLQMDTLLFHSEEEPELFALQQKKWLPILEWFQKRFNVTQEFTKGLEPPPISAETRAVVARHFLSYDLDALTGVNFGVEALKSPILMLACVERHLEPKEAVLLARLEEEYQLLRWGRVPWAHELNQAELTARVAASLLLVHCSSERQSAKSKGPDHDHSQHAAQQ